ncbi:TPA: hypothetical protein ACN96K_004647, partial [Vibrio parahaemolyticus]
MKAVSGSAICEGTAFFFVIIHIRKAIGMMDISRDIIIILRYLISILKLSIHILDFLKGCYQILL